MITTLPTTHNVHTERLCLFIHFTDWCYFCCVCYSTYAMRSLLEQLQWCDHHFALLKVYFMFSCHALFRSAPQHTTNVPYYGANYFQYLGRQEQLCSPVHRREPPERQQAVRSGSDRELGTDRWDEEDARCPHRSGELLKKWQKWKLFKWV